ncbi:Tetratricopeptide repeat [Musa troglodytarum]|uniref:Tetratricopeptide repeat n=1 Tax=Musa troglodytarum TaxID=320322 RepID=A0A9E7FFV7_9LILI|nr:Tetratricopeptide repeat [Musa troglodytarum]
MGTLPNSGAEVLNLSSRPSLLLTAVGVGFLDGRNFVAVRGRSRHRCCFALKRRQEISNLRPWPFTLSKPQQCQHPWSSFVGAADVALAGDPHCQPKASCMYASVMLRQKFYLTATNYFLQAIEKWDIDDQDLAQTPHHVCAATDICLSRAWDKDSSSFALPSVGQQLISIWWWHHDLGHVRSISDVTDLA